MNYNSLKKRNYYQLKNKNPYIIFKRVLKSVICWNKLSMWWYKYTDFKFTKILHKKIYVTVSFGKQTILQKKAL